MNGRAGSVLFLGKEKDAHVEKAAAFCRANFEHVSVCLGAWGDPFPAGAGLAAWDYIISYLSRWIVSEDLLKQAKFAINFHPGPPEYPGYGCNNFAIYEEARSYGVCCHHMAPRVDTGAIIATRRFPVLANDDAGTLLARAYDFQLVLFYEIVACVIRGEELPLSSEHWTRTPFTRKQFDRLGQITADMTPEDVARRMRATNVSALRRAG
jgi:methionyl-tRNA formyltransferase